MPINKLESTLKEIKTHKLTNKDGQIKVYNYNKLMEKMCQKER